VSTLVGLDTQRGDQLTVEAMPFDNTLNLDPSSPPVAAPSKKPDDMLSMEYLKKNPVLLWGSVGGGVLLISV